MRMLIFLTFSVLSFESMAKCAGPSPEFVRMEVYSCVSYEERAKSEIPFIEMEKKSELDAKYLMEKAKKASVVTARPIETVEIIKWFADGKWYEHEGAATLVENKNSTEYFIDSPEEMCNQLLSNTIELFEVHPACCDMGKHSADCWTKLPVLHSTYFSDNNLKINCSHKTFENTAQCSATKKN